LLLHLLLLVSPVLLHRGNFLTAVLRRDRTVHRRQLDVGPDRWQRGRHRTVHGLLVSQRVHIPSTVHWVGRYRVHTHRVRFGIDQGLRVLFNELRAALVVARWERSVTNRIERGFIQTTTAVDVGRRGGQAVAWSEERRHLDEERVRITSSGGEGVDGVEFRLRLHRVLILGRKESAAKERAALISS